MKIVTNISDSPVGKKPRKALWDYEYREVDFDLNGVCLLEAIGRLARHSRLYGLFEHPDVIALRPRDTKNVDDEWVVKAVVGGGANGSGSGVLFGWGGLRTQLWG